MVVLYCEFTISRTSNDYGYESDHPGTADPVDYSPKSGSKSWQSSERLTEIDIQAHISDEQ